VVKGGRVELAVNQSFTGAGTTTLDITGGLLSLAGGSPPGGKTLTIEGTATFSGGTLDGGPGGGSRGLLVVGGSLVSDGTVMQGLPDITMNPLAGTTTVGGSVALTGVGEFTKTGGGTVRLDQQISAVDIRLSQGTLLLGADNRIANATAMVFEGGTFSTGGYDDTVGTLTLFGNTTIDFGSGSSLLSFADSSLYSGAWSGQLTINNWTDGSDDLFFGSASTGLTSAQLGKIWFNDPWGNGYFYGAMIDANGRVRPGPVPEPATILALVLAGAALLGHERKRLLRTAADLLKRSGFLQA
jgi:hypothetical protein